MKIFVASFNRASDGAISKLVDKLRKEDMFVHTPHQANYILAVGDRTEVFDFVLKWWRQGKPIVHLWAGEISQGTEDEVYRHAMTIMSCLQLCTNIEAQHTVRNFLEAIGMKPNAHTVGNIMLDNLDIDESVVPENCYDLVLYNPPTIGYSEDKIIGELEYINDIVEPGHYWIAPNGDKYSSLVGPYVNCNNLPRPKFLGLLKNCRKFITNSSSAYYEAPFLMAEEDIILIGERNRDRNSRTDMNIPNASDNIIKILKKELK